MNALELLVLGRTLIKIAGEAMPPAGGNRSPSSIRSIMIDVAKHPDTSIGEITARTGFPQSHVSLAVARLKEGRVFVTTVDPHDRRRTLVRTAPAFRRGLSHSLPQTAAIDDALAEALGTDDPRELASVTAALESLARRLKPERRGHGRLEQAEQEQEETL
jgi:DNA-binding MarR family transcriptional regulator